jgi:hypothetical protein
MRGLLVLAAATIVLVLGAGYATSSASAHRAVCHRLHLCPSDHATYRWRQPGTGIRWLCVAPYSDKRNVTFRKRIVYGGRAYWCKR